LKTRVRRPRKRGYRATGVRDILLACQDVDLDKEGVTVNWNTLIKNYDLESELPVDGMHLEDINDSDDESETGSMDGLGMSSFTPWAHAIAVAVCNATAILTKSNFHF
jgi:hypothetical protein